MRFKVTVTGMDAVANKLNAAAARAEHAVAEQAAKDTEPYVPMLTGSLKNRTQVKENEIIYPGPYARFLYYGKVMVDPKTGSPWARKGAIKVPTSKDLSFNRAYHKNAQAHWFAASKSLNRDKWVRVAKRTITKELK